jgi:16S rRNA processing protein RimM
METVILESARYHQESLLIKLEHIHDRNEAELLRGMYVMLPFDTLDPLADNEVYYFQLYGMEVYTDAGDYLGKVTAILETGANNVYILKGSPRGDVLIPDTDEVIQEINTETRRIIIHPIPGLLSDPINDSDE